MTATPTTTAAAPIRVATFGRSPAKSDGERNGEERPGSQDGRGEGDARSLQAVEVEEIARNPDQRPHHRHDAQRRQPDAAESGKPLGGDGHDAEHDRHHPHHNDDHEFGRYVEHRPAHEHVPRAPREHGHDGEQDTDAHLRADTP